jgi:hypothetical protein
MSTELTTWLATSPALREQRRELVRVNLNTTVALAKVASVAEVGRAALFETFGLVQLQQQAAALVPEAAAKLDFITTQATIGMAQQLNRLAGQ